MKHRAGKAVLALSMYGLLGASLGGASPLENFQARLTSDGSEPTGVARQSMQEQEVRIPTRGEALPPGIVASRDDAGMPTFMWAGREQRLAPASVRTSPEQAAWWYLRQQANRYHLSARSLKTASVQRVQRVGDGAFLVSFKQTHGGYDVYQQSLKVLMKADYSLVAISGNLNLEASSAPLAKKQPFVLSPEQAIVEATADLLRVPVEPVDFLENGVILEDDSRFFELLPGSALEDYGLSLTLPARARSIVYPVDGQLVPAYYLELNAGSVYSTDSLYFAYVVAADDGRLLMRENLTSDVAFSYRVWADAAGDKRPYQGPKADYVPHPTGVPDGSEPAYVTPVLVSMDGFNKNPSGQPDPWLASDATISFGNNSIAYADHYPPDGYSPGDTRATTTARRTFDRSYNVTQEPMASSDQIMASVTEVFYTTNWLHDWYYDSGFNEAAGNAQTDNYGRGGVEEDPLRAEGQDNALNYDRNNANMSTPADGVSPRMQMYLWTGDTEVSVDVPKLGRTLEASYAVFGPRSFNTTGNLQLVNDGSGTTSDACETIRTNFSRKIAVVDRGNCDFITKAANVQAAGAIGMMVVNNVAGDPVTMAASTNQNITIPSVGITLDDGSAVKALMVTQTISATLNRVSAVERDGTVDNTVVAHEWGHYLHKRLVACTTDQCRAQSEGWADFVALHMIVKDNDTLNGTYGLAIYATDASIFLDNAYYGLRRAPYSTDFTKNALTFRNIADNEPLPTGIDIQDFGEPSEVHNAGEIWTAMLWEVYAALQNQTKGTSPRYTYEEARRRMSNYVVGGMMLAPSEPTFTEQRDALLAAIAALDEQDFELAAQAFARRGAGTCAVSPFRTSTDFIGVVESYELQPSVAFVSATVTETGSCDLDGYIDAYEDGSIEVEVENRGAQTLAGAVVRVEAEEQGVSFPLGPTANLADVKPFGRGKVSIPVHLDGSFVDISGLHLSAHVEAPNVCAPADGVAEVRVNLDETLATSTLDDFEADTLSWTSMLGAPEQVNVWKREEESLFSHHVRGEDIAGVNDSSLVSPALKVSDTEALVVSVSHKYSFETGPAAEGEPDSYWDGGVMEISLDDGKTWADVSTYADPGYPHTITTEAGNPLGGRQAFTGTNASYPDYDTLTLDFGQALAGKSIQLRFRVGTDEAVGNEGWTLDNLSVSGILNTPFNQVVADQAQPGTFYTDLDGDHYGLTDEPVLACASNPGQSAAGGDCNDANSAVNPQAPELCDGIDNDCNGSVDDNVISGQTVYADEDGDGFGDETQFIVSCEVPEGYVVEAGDCDDSDPTTNPGAVETCDGVDNDCNAQIDDNAEGAQIWFQDNDGDGYGSILSTQQSCEAPEGYVSVVGDCNDNDATIYYGAPEPADGIDHDCDGLTTNPETPTPTPPAVTPTLEPTPTSAVTPTSAPNDTPTPTDTPDDPTDKPGDTPTPDVSGQGCSCSQPDANSGRQPGAVALLGLGMGLMLSRRRRQH